MVWIASICYTNLAMTAWGTILFVWIASAFTKPRNDDSVVIVSVNLRFAIAMTNQ